MTTFPARPAALAIILMLYSTGLAMTRVLFLGLSGEGAPAIERFFDRALRDRLTTIPDIATYGFDDSQRFRRMLDIDRSITVSEGQMNALEVHLPDSVLIVWLQVKRLVVVPERKNLIHADIRGDLQTGLSVYDLSHRVVAYRGIIESAADKKAGFIFFSPISLETVSAANREALIGELIEKSVSGCAKIIDSLCQAVHTGRKNIAPAIDTINNRPPSISDVFTVPSVEAAEISNKNPSKKAPPVKTGK